LKKRIVLYLGFLLLLLSGCVSQQKHLRSVASLENKDCLQLIRSLLDLPEEGLPPKTMNRILAFGPKVRRAFLQRLLPYMKNNIRLHRRYADVVTRLVRAGKLDKKWIDQFLEEKMVDRFRYKWKGERLLVFDQWNTKYAERLEVQAEIVNRWELSDVDRDGLYESLREFPYSNREWKFIQHSLGKVPEGKISADEFVSYLHFASAYKDKKRLFIFRDLPLYFSQEPNKKLAKRFQRFEKKFDAYEKQVLKRKRRKYTKSLELDEAEIEKLAISEAKVARRVYQNITYACRARGDNIVKSKSAKHGMALFMGLGLTSVTGAYMINNWDKEKDGAWFGNLGWDIATILAYNYLFAKILGNTESGFWGKAFYSYGLYAKLDIINAVFYAQVFGVSHKEAEARLKKLHENPLWREEVQKYLEYLDKQNTWDLYRKNFSHAIRETSAEPDSRSVEVVADPTRLTREDLNDEGIKEALLRAISLSIYEEKSGEWIKTGHIGLDRYLFHRAFDVVGAPKDLVAGVLIFHTLCSHMYNPKKALALALTIYVVDKTTSDIMYYYSRRRAIDQ
jgi:drug/metabolite transporter superfamily protein YnfA